MNNLVSIVVLVGDVESYINECLESLVKQTHRNIEILLVNKGSKDNTMKICEYYERKDRRIHIINVDARTSKNKKNVGIKNSNGKYITFVDAGDRVSPDYIEYMFNKMQEDKADIVCVRSYNSDEKKKYPRLYKIYKNKDILENYLHMNLKSSFYAKLYKKSLFDDIEYPEVEFCDDLMTTYKLYDKASRVVDSGLNKYCVVVNKRYLKDRAKDKDKMKKMEACFDMLNFFETNYPEYVDYCKTKICYEAIDLFRNVTDKSYRRQLYNYIKIYRKYALKDKRFEFDKKSLCIRSMLGYNFMKLSFYLEKSI